MVAFGLEENRFQLRGTQHVIWSHVILIRRGCVRDGNFRFVLGSKNLGNLAVACSFRKLTDIAFGMVLGSARGIRYGLSHTGVALRRGLGSPPVWLSPYRAQKSPGPCNGHPVWLFPYREDIMMGLEGIPGMGFPIPGPKFNSGRTGMA